MAESDIHRPCTIVCAAEGRTEPCAQGSCAFWEQGCILAAVDGELESQPEVAELLLQLRRHMERARPDYAEGDLRRFHRRLATGRE
jgi:hypothetical protein